MIEASEAEWFKDPLNPRVKAVDAGQGLGKGKGPLSIPGRGSPAGSVQGSAKGSQGLTIEMMGGSNQGGSKQGRERRGSLEGSVKGGSKQGSQQGSVNGEEPSPKKKGGLFGFLSKKEKKEENNKGEGEVAENREGDPPLLVG